MKPPKDPFSEGPPIFFQPMPAGKMNVKWLRHKFCAEHSSLTFRRLVARPCALFSAGCPDQPLEQPKPHFLSLNSPEHLVRRTLH